MENTKPKYIPINHSGSTPLRYAVYKVNNERGEVNNAVHEVNNKARWGSGKIVKESIEPSEATKPYAVVFMYNPPLFDKKEDRTCSTLDVLGDVFFPIFELGSHEESPGYVRVYNLTTMASGDRVKLWQERKCSLCRRFREILSKKGEDLEPSEIATKWWAAWNLSKNSPSLAKLSDKEKLLENDFRERCWERIRKFAGREKKFIGVASSREVKDFTLDDDMPDSGSCLHPLQVAKAISNLTAKLK